MNVFLRYGSHSEKEYFEKMRQFFDGIIFGSNLLEITPAATVSLIAKYCGGQHQKKRYIIDPMTYSFGEYIDPKTNKLVSNLDWLKSKSKKSSGIKSSYKKLSKNLGSHISASVENKIAIQLNDLQKDDIRKSICESVISYQKNRIKDLLKEDKDSAPFSDALPEPYLVFSPYFYIDKERSNEWLDVYQKICTDSLIYSDNLYLKLCFDYTLLSDNNFIKRVTELTQNGLKGMCLWANQFNEKTVDVEYLKGFRQLVEKLKEKNIEIFNRHGGYFSYMLSRFGLSITSHSVGYGDKKNILPLSGGAPTVNYYIPALHGKFGIPKTDYIFNAMGINSPDDFFKKICDCIICKGVIKDSINNFEYFGETYKSETNPKRSYQTSAAAKRSRFHYLFSKIMEKKNVNSKDFISLLQELKEIKQILDLEVFGSGNYIKKWIETLS